MHEGCFQRGSRLAPASLGRLWSTARVPDGSEAVDELAETILRDCPSPTPVWEVFKRHQTGADAVPVEQALEQLYWDGMFRFESRPAADPADPGSRLSPGEVLSAIGDARQRDPASLEDVAWLVPTDLHLRLSDPGGRARLEETIAHIETPSSSARSRFEHQWWLLLIVPTFGLLSWMAFVYLGARLKRRAWTAAGFVYLGATIASLALAGHGTGTTADVGSLIIVGVWLVSICHAFVIRPEVLDRFEFADQPQIKEARHQITVRREAAELAREHPSLAAAAGIGRDQAAYGGLVDVNHATAEEFAALPGFTPDPLSASCACGRESTASTPSSISPPCSTCRRCSSTASAAA